MKQHLDRLYQVIGEPGEGAPVAGYVRYSSDMQDPASIQTQKRRIQEYCDRKGWVIVRWYEEPERSAKYEDIAQRAVFAHLLTDAGTEFTVVICYVNNRWAPQCPGRLLLALPPAAQTGLVGDGRRQMGHRQGAADRLRRRLRRRHPDERRLLPRPQHADHRREGGSRAGRVPQRASAVRLRRPDYDKAPDGAPANWKPPRKPATPDPETFPALVRIGELAAQGYSD